MERNSTSILVGMVKHYFESQIKIPDVQREDTAWTLGQKQLLIDSIYNNYDIPKFYLRKDDADDEIWWLLDGQQRLTAITDFIEDKFTLDGGSDVTSIPKNIHNKKFSELPAKDKGKINGRSLDFVIMVCTDDEEEDLFLRLNNGTPLNAAEKRNAVKGEFKDLVKKLSKHAFFKTKINFPKTRYAVDGVVALGWESNKDLDNRLVFHFGDTEEVVKNKLYEKDIILEFYKEFENGPKEKNTTRNV